MTHTVADEFARTLAAAAIRRADGIPGDNGPTDANRGERWRTPNE
jgi:hypothetical protein